MIKNLLKFCPDQTERMLNNQTSHLAEVPIQFFFTTEGDLARPSEVLLRENLR